MIKAMEELVKKSDVKKVIDHIIAGAQNNAARHPSDEQIQTLAEQAEVTLLIAWGLIDALKTYKLEKT